LALLVPAGFSGEGFDGFNVGDFEVQLSIIFGS
jgi:hypothetical protein